MSDTYFVYVLCSETTGRRYVGSCADLEGRLQRHNAGESKATKSGTPWRLVYTEAFETRSLACQREQLFKTGRDRERLDDFERANDVSPRFEAEVGWSVRRGDKSPAAAGHPDFR